MFNREFAQHPWKLTQTPPLHHPASGIVCIAWLAEAAQLDYTHLNRSVQNDVTPAGLLDAATRCALDAALVPIFSDDPGDLIQNNQPIVVRVRRPESEPYWVIVLAQAAGYYRVANPDFGLQWIETKRFHAILDSTIHTESPDAWRNSPLNAQLVALLERRLRALEIDGPTSTRLQTRATADVFELAAIDAGARMLEHMLTTRRVWAGTEATALLEYLLGDAQSRIPQRYWTLHAVDGVLQFRGAVAARIQTQPSPPAPRLTSHKDPRWVTWLPAIIQPYARLESRTFLMLIVTGSLLAAGGVFIQAILLSALLDLGQVLNTPAERAFVVGLLVIFGVCVMALQGLIQLGTVDLGHRLDGRLRMSLLALLPMVRVPHPQRDSVGDLFERVHHVTALRMIPQYLAEFVQLAALLVFTLLGIFWIDPLVGIVATVRAVSLLIVNGINQLYGTGRAEARSLLGRLGGLYHDVFRGVFPLRSHNAYDSMREVYSERLTRWGNAQWRQLSLEVWLSSAASLVSHLLIVVLVVVYALRDPDLSNWLLLLFWTFSLYTIGQQLIEALYYLQRDRVKLARYGQLLDTPTEADMLPQEDDPIAASPTAVAIQMKALTVQRNEQTLLSEITLQINPGEHIAIVGASGSGKSSLAAVLLGFLSVSSGTLQIDDEPLTYERLQALRAHLAWVSADVQLWQRSLLGNIAYGASEPDIPRNIEAAELIHLLERLPQGLQTSVGADGRTLSGGEGQRVRFARALARTEARLVILDEPFRELEPARRQRLMARAREHWRDATLLYITHAPPLALDFDRVLVMDGGRIVQDARPGSAQQQLDRPFAQLLASYARTQDVLRSSHWRQWVIEEGLLRVTDAAIQPNDHNETNGSAHG